MLNWEIIPQDTAGILQRTKVVGGWLVKEVHEVYLEHNNGSFILENNGHTWTSSITFVPDVLHQWKIE